MKRERISRGAGGPAGKRRQGRRGAVAVPVAVGMTVLMGFAALAVDVGMIYSTQAELQRTADAAALAAATELMNFGADGPLVASREAAAEFAARNKVLNAEVGLATTDTVFGRAALDSGTGKYAFTATEEFPNAIRVRVRRSDGSPTGPVGLLFANIFGFSHTNMGAQATALLVPRDIVLVMDLSGSHTDDSELAKYKKTNINLYDVWANLPGNRNLTPQTDGFGFTSEVYVTDNGDGTSTVSVDMTSDDSGETPALSNLTFTLPAAAQSMALSTATYTGGQYGTEAGYNPSAGVNGLKFEYTGSASGQLGETGVATHSFSFTIPTGYLSEMTVATKAGSSADTSVAYELAPGPTFGNMKHYGTYQVTSSYNPAADDGLTYLPYGYNWSNSTLTNMLYAQGYNAAEVGALMSGAYDSSGAWYARVAVALGLAQWRSGINGGLWQQQGLEPGNGNSWVSWDYELTWVEDYPYPGGSWKEYMDYMKGSSAMTSANSAFRNRFGLKTFVNFLLEKMPEKANTPALSLTPTQPMQAVKDAALKLVEIVDDLDGDDQLSLVSYGTYGYGPADKPNEMSWLTDDFDLISSRISNLQAGMWSTYTNVAQGIDKGRFVVRDTDHGARQYAAKVMILLTDGMANRTRYSANYDLTQAPLDAKQAAIDTKAAGVQIYTVSVGVDADRTLMQEIATIGKGETFHAEGEISTYEAQLQEIFQKLGGKRPVMLIE